MRASFEYIVIGKFGISFFLLSRSHFALGQETSDLHLSLTLDIKIILRHRFLSLFKYIRLYAGKKKRYISAC